MKRVNEIESCSTCIYRKLLFDKLSEVEHKIVNESRNEYLCAKGEILKKEGQKIQSFMYLRKGLVKIYKTDKYGKDHILAISRPGEFINLLTHIAYKVTRNREKRLITLLFINNLRLVDL